MIFVEEMIDALTFVNVFEQILKQMRGVRNFHVEMTAELSQKGQTMGDHPFISWFASSIMHTTFCIYCCCWLKRVWVVKATGSSTLFILALTVF